MTWLVYLGHLIFFSSSSIFDNILGEFVRRRKSHLHKISKPKLSRWKNKIKYRLVVALFLSLSLFPIVLLKRNYRISFSWCPQKSKQKLNSTTKIPHSPFHANNTVWLGMVLVLVLVDLWRGFGGLLPMKLVALPFLAFKEEHEPLELAECIIPLLETALDTPSLSANPPP